MLGFTATTMDILMIFIVMLIMGTIIISFFSSENDAGGISVKLTKILMCDVLYFFFGPSCAGLGVTES